MALEGSTAPSTAIPDGIQLFAVDVAGSHELQVMDEAGNTTTLSPHNFSLIGDRSEDMAWSFYSERNSLAINADMAKAMRIVERLSGEKIIHIKDLATSTMLEDEQDATKIAYLQETGEISNVATWNYQMWTFLAEVLFNKPVKFLAQATFQGKAIFKNETFFQGRATFADSDMGGQALLKAGSKEVQIVFKQQFETTPIITVSALNSELKVGIKDQSTTGFTLYTTDNTAQDELVNWIAISITNSTYTESEVEQHTSNTTEEVTTDGNTNLVTESDQQQSNVATETEPTNEANTDIPIDDTQELVASHSSEINETPVATNAATF